MNSEERDLKQVGLTSRASEQLRELAENKEYFGDEQDVYRLAVAVAIAQDIKISESIKKCEFTTKWRVADDYGDSSGTGERLDDERRTLAHMIATFRPESAAAPYRYSQYLAVVGIGYLHREVLEKGRSLNEVLDYATNDA